MIKIISDFFLLKQHVLELYSEAGLQHELAHYLKNKLPDYIIRLEYPITRVYRPSPGFMKKDAPRVAEEAVQATLKGNHVYVPTKTFKVIVLLLKIIPHSFFSLVSSVLAPGRYDSK